MDTYPACIGDQVTGTLKTIAYNVPAMQQCTLDLNAAACNGKDPFLASTNCKSIFTGLVAQSKACDPSCAGGGYQCAVATNACDPSTSKCLGPVADNGDCSSWPV